MSRHDYPSSQYERLGECISGGWYRHQDSKLPQAGYTKYHLSFGKGGIGAYQNGYAVGPKISY